MRKPPKMRSCKLRACGCAICAAGQYNPVPLVMAYARVVLLVPTTFRLAYKKKLLMFFLGWLGSLFLLHIRFLVTGSSSISSSLRSSELGAIFLRFRCLRINPTQTNVNNSRSSVYFNGIHHLCTASSIV